MKRNKDIKVLIACEFTGVIREAFKELGMCAVSCDYKPTEIPGNHYEGDVMDIIHEQWDLMIASPPCTYLTYAGTSQWRLPKRARERLNALNFFLDLWEADIPYICLENPFGIIDKVIEPHHQQIHPYYFGDAQMKRTCLWLKNLPLLKYHRHDDFFGKRTATAKPKSIYIDKSGKKRNLTESITGKGNGGNIRSRSFSAIAQAMADQWGPVIKKLTI